MKGSCRLPNICRRGSGISTSFHSMWSTSRRNPSGATARDSARVAIGLRAPRSRKRWMSDTISACPVVFWRRMRPLPPPAKGTVWGQYTSMTFSASWRVVSTSGAAPDAARLLQTEVHEGQQHRILVGGGEAAGVEERQQLLAEGESPAVRRGQGGGHRPSTSPARGSPSGRRRGGRARRRGSGGSRAGGRGRRSGRRSRPTFTPRL